MYIVVGKSSKYKLTFHNYCLTKPLTNIIGQMTVSLGERRCRVVEDVVQRGFVRF